MNVNLIKVYIIGSEEESDDSDEEGLLGSTDEKDMEMEEEKAPEDMKPPGFHASAPVLVIPSEGIETEHYRFFEFPWVDRVGMRFEVLHIL